MEPLTTKQMVRLLGGKPSDKRPDRCPGAFLPAGGTECGRCGKDFLDHLLFGEAMSVSPKLRDVPQRIAERSRALIASGEETCAADAFDRAHREVWSSV
jgi:hypothetical protein